MWYSSLMACKAFYENYFTSSALTETHLLSIPDLTFLVFSTDKSDTCIESKRPLVKRGKLKQNKAKAFPSKYHFLDLRKQVLVEPIHL